MRIRSPETAPWIHTLALALAIGLGLSLLTVPRLVWLVDHPESLAVVAAALSRLLGAGVSKVTRWHVPGRARRLTTERVHDRIDAVIDTLAYIQADLDTAANAVQRVRAEAQQVERDDEGRGRE